MNLPKYTTPALVALSALFACTPEQQKLANNVLRPGELPAGEVDIVGNLPTMPGATILGLGYDPTEQRVFRNRVLASQLSVAREAWVSPERGGLYYYAETDRRYLVPRHVMLLPQHQRSDVQYTIAESKSAFARKLAASVKASGGYGLFSASVEGAFDSSSQGESESTYAQRTERIHLWSMWLTPKQDLDPTFKKRIEALPLEIDDAARRQYEELVADYGVGVVSYVALGGRVDYNQRMNRDARQSERDIKLSMSASYGSYFSASGSVATSSQDSKSSSKTETSVEVFGGNAAEAALLMEKGGDLVPWSVSVPKDPAVVGLHVVDLWKYVPAGPRRDELERAVYRHARHRNPSVPVRITGGAVPQIFVDDGHLVIPHDYPDQATAEHVRVTVLDARNLHVRDDRYFYSTEGTLSSGGSVAALRAAGCNGCEQCADFVDDFAIKRQYGEDPLRTLQRANSDDWAHRFSNEQRQECIRVLQTYTPSRSGGGTYPSLTEIKSFLAGIGHAELAIVTTVGDTGALHLRREVMAELRALGAKAEPAPGAYLLVGSRGASSFEVVKMGDGGFQALLFDDDASDRYSLALVAGVPLVGGRR